MDPVAIQESAMNILFVSHCDFSGNSAMHVFSLANRLSTLGHSCIVAVPANADRIAEHGRAEFQALDYADTLSGRLAFPDGRGPDAVHAWTPRELVRRQTTALVKKYHCPYLVHLEDNEEEILRQYLRHTEVEIPDNLPASLIDALVPEHRSHPVRYLRFLAAAAGVTALIDTLLEFKPKGPPGCVFSPGFDDQYQNLPRSDPGWRSSHGIAPDETLVVYTGNIHEVNLEEVQSLYLAVMLLRREGVRIRLAKTGWNHVDMSWVDKIGLTPHVLDLGFLPRDELPRLLSAADLLVQPGGANEFNDYRVPSKLPEYLASGKPVILGNTNIGRMMSDQREAFLFEEGDAVELSRIMKSVLADPKLAFEVGRRGREFALSHFSWEKSAGRLSEFYEASLGPKADDRSVALPTVPSSETQEDAVRTRSDSGVDLPVKLLAFYLPQFHPIPENDQWWGSGFTEWTNVTRAAPQYEGHIQPQLPRDMGFYDLRVPEVLEKQAELAGSYGVFGFCLYYYWFNGRVLLDTPLRNMLRRNSPQFPICICWANENWTRRWDGAEHEVLIQQDYEDGWEDRFFDDIAPILKSPHYIEVDGCPLLLVYRVNQLPDARASAERWRELALQCGLRGLHLCAVQSFGVDDPTGYGFDSAVQFPPHGERALVQRDSVAGLSEEFEGYLEDYVQFVRNTVTKRPPRYKCFPGVVPAWDNTPRRGKRAHIMINSSPSSYQAWLRSSVISTLNRSATQAPLVFVNAWNEWAEGAYLEPNQKDGAKYLEATRKALCEGISHYYQARGVDLTEGTVRKMIQESASRLAVTERGAPPVNADPVPQDAPIPAKLLVQRYRGYRVDDLSYATVRDYCDSHDHLHSLATSNGDLKDCQRPWVLKAILSHVRPGARLLEIGAGEPLVADVLQRMGYDVAIVDPYEGAGNGPTEFERFRTEFKGLEFIKAEFSDRLDLDEASYDCIYSISVLEHVPGPGMLSLFKGLRRFLKPSGVHIHAVDHVHRGDGAEDHLRRLKRIVNFSGIAATDLDSMLERMSSDTETYFLSAESHNRWRGGVPYAEFPMRVCVSIQIAGLAGRISLPEQSFGRRVGVGR